MTPRITLATERPWLVVAADGLLAAFNDAGVLNPLDVKAAQTIARLLGETDDRVLLAAALAVRGTRYGHVCIRLDTVRDAVVVDGQDPEEIEQLPWPETDTWAEAVKASPLVTNPDPPLVYEQGRLYLSRYHHYEQQVASLLLSRLSTPSGRGGDAASSVPPASEPMRLFTLPAGGSGASQMHPGRESGPDSDDRPTASFTPPAGGSGASEMHPGRESGPDSDDRPTASFTLPSGGIGEGERPRFGRPPCGFFHPPSGRVGCI